MIELKHKCRAVHVESVAVKEQAEGKDIWNGIVEVFELQGHEAARRCYAWGEVPKDIRYQFVTMLQKGLVISPETAVKAWLAAKPVTIHPVVDNRANLKGSSDME